MIHVHLMRAAACVNRGNYSAALSHFQEALTEDPNSAEAHARLSICLSLMNRRYGALEEANRALRLNPELGAAHVAAGLAAMRVEDVPAAEVSLRRALELNPFDIDALTVRCIIALNNRDATKLHNAADALATRSPNDPLAKCYLSRAAEMQGNADEAEKHARSALAIDPELSSAHEAIGWAFLAQDRLDKGRDAALSALSLNPQDRGALGLLAAVSLRKNRFVGQIHRLGLWLTFQPTSRLLIMTLGILALSMMGGRIFRHFDMPIGDRLLDIFYFGFFVILMFSYFSFKRLVEKDTKNVKLTRDY